MERRHLGAIIAGVVVAAVVVLGLGLADVVPGFYLVPSAGGNGSHRVVFTQSGLPRNTSWSVTLNGQAATTNATSIAFEEPAGSYNYTVGPMAGYTMEPAAGVAVIAGSDVTLPITFSRMAENFSVQFVETGLPSGVIWSVTLNGSIQRSSSTAVVFSEPNGSYAYSVPTADGFVPAPAVGTVSVRGEAASVVIEFGANGPPIYGVTVTESGLPAGTTWSVTLGGTPETTAATSLLFVVANGSYSFSVARVGSYVPTPGSGNVEVQGSNQTIAVVYAKEYTPGSGLYPVTFHQVGLPENVSWGITGGALNASGLPEFGQMAEGSAFTVYLPNGSYNWSGGLYSPDYAVPPNGQLVVAPTQGTFRVAGYSENETLTFTAILPTSTVYTVTMTETGLPVGGEWSVVLGGENRSAASGAPITFSEPNGTYFYTAAASAPGFGAGGVAGWVVVTGSPVEETAVFEVKYPLSFNETGLFSTDQWAVQLTSSTGNDTISMIGGRSLTCFEPNGTYDFVVIEEGYNVTPASGTVTIQGGPETVQLTFRLVTRYSLSFGETGLPPGDTWGAAACTTLQTQPTCNLTDTSQSSLTYHVQNGSYSWSAFAFVDGYVATPWTGVVEVDGSGAWVALNFTPFPAADRQVVFSLSYSDYNSPSGLPSGSTWSVSVAGTTWSSAGPSIALGLPNGTYSYETWGPAGYDTVPAFGSFTVNYSQPLYFLLVAAQVEVALVASTTLTPHLVAHGPCSEDPAFEFLGQAAPAPATVLLGPSGKGRGPSGPGSAG